MKQQIRKQNLLEMLDMVKLQIANTWTMSAKRKQEKLKELDNIKTRILNANDSMAMFMENSMSTKCMPTMRTRKIRKDFEKQLIETVNLMDPIGGSFRSDVSTVGGDSIYPNPSNFSFEFDDLSLEDTATTADSNLESHKKDSNSTTDNTSSSDGSDDVVVTTSSLRSDDGPIGVSITTWKLQKFNKKSTTTPVSSSERRQKFIAMDKDEESLFSNSPTIPENCSIVSHSHDESDADEVEKEEDQRDGSNTSSVEEFQITFGDGIAVQASKNKTVRFMNVKPSAEDNINRAKALLADAKRVKKGGVYERKPRWIPK